MWDFTKPVRFCKNKYEVSRGVVYSRGVFESYWSQLEVAICRMLSIVFENLKFVKVHCYLFKYSSDKKALLID